MNLTNGDTFVLIYLDFQGIYETVDHRFLFEGIGFELTDVDKFDYYELKSTFLKKVYNTIFIGGSLSPLYWGEYSLQDSTSFVIKYDFYESLSVDLKYSKLIKEVNGSLKAGNLLVVAGVEHIKRSYLSEVSINNISIKLGLNY
jgi:hypothetical protein